MKSNSSQNEKKKQYGEPDKNPPLSFIQEFMEVFIFSIMISVSYKVSFLVILAFRITGEYRINYRGQ